jgi:integrase
MGRRATGEGSIGKRKDGTYYGTIRLDGMRKWVYGETRKEVSVKLKALSHKHAQGINLDADKVKVGVFLERWLEEIVKQRNKPRTYESYKRIVALHLTPKLGNIPLSALKPDHVQVLVNSLAAKKRAPRTVRNVRAVLRRALNHAIRWRYIPFNAAALVETPRIERYEIKAWTRQQARTLLDSVKGHRLEALYVIALLLGLREGEVLGLLITNLDLDSGTVKIDGALQWQDGKLVRGSVKTSSSARTLPLPLTLIQLLKTHLARQQAEFPENKYVFASTAGTPISPFNLLKQFKAILKKAGLPQIRFHDLRHFCAMFLIAAGAHPRTIMEILGHAQISTTLNIYGHVLQETQIAAVNDVDKLLFGE